MIGMLHVPSFLTALLHTVYLSCRRKGKSSFPVQFLVSCRTSMDDKSDRFIGSLIGTAVGDSLGAQREGTSGFQEVREIGPRYTDDTVMTIGVAESLVEAKGFHYFHMAEQFIRNYEREPWRRYGTAPPRV